MTEIAIVDDEKVVLNSLRIGFTREGLTVRTFALAGEFLAYLADNDPEVVLLDLLLPDGHGLEVLRTIRQTKPAVATIIITAHGDIPSAVEAMKIGAFDYVSKPFDFREMARLVARACRKNQPLGDADQRPKTDRLPDLNDIIGQSPPMRDLLGKARQLSRIGPATLLLLGESGTGKDLLAKAIHGVSSRRHRQFIEINCAALPEQLLESELFGHERGAFTDAKSRKAGLVELAEGGTLFLDEIGEMPMGLQAKLLKFIETRRFRRVGATTELQADLFIVASTNRDLHAAVAEHTFRKDLYYRLAVVELHLPPLRHRPGDVALLVDHYWRLYIEKFNKPRLVLAPEAWRAFEAYHWPGNVRELKNILEQLVIFGGDDTVGYPELPGTLRIGLESRQGGFSLPGDMDPPLATVAAGEPSLGEAVSQLEIERINRALAQCGGVKARAARLLGISRYALIRKLKRIG